MGEGAAEGDLRQRWCIAGTPNEDSGSFIQKHVPHTY